MHLLPEILQEIRKCSKKLQTYFDDIHAENERLRVENAQLRARINSNSTNSNAPPSSNPFKKPKSLRVKTGKKPGAQAGHKGSTLKTDKNPDKVVRHKVCSCSHCGRDISEHKAYKHKKHQVIDVQVTRVVTEHQTEVKCCPYCGKQTFAAFPYGTGHYVQYGPCYSAMMVCFNQGNHIPYDRLSKISKDIFGIAISCGTLVNIVKRCAGSLKGSMEYIKDQLKRSAVLHVDETGIRINGKNHWLHNASSNKYTYVKTHLKRGSIATDDIGILASFKGVAVHDFWKSYYNYTDCSHAICNAHIIRELNSVIENSKQLWALRMKALLIEINKQANACLRYLPTSKAKQYEARYGKILVIADKENPIKKDIMQKRHIRGRIPRSKARNLIDRMKLYKNDILRFMYDPNIPFDNNQAERDIRMSKLQQKISGCFRSSEGNEAFGKIRSYISTASKHEISMFESIYSAMSGNPLFAGDTS